MPKKPKHPSRRKGGKKPPQQHGHLPEICVLAITGISGEGELVAQPVKWDERKKPPHIVVTESGRSRAAAVGDRVLCKLRKVKPHLFQALVIRVLPKEEIRNVLGVFVATASGGIIEPVSRKMKESFMVTRKDAGDAEPGELVAGVTLPGMPSIGMTYAKITDRLGRLDSPRAASLIAASMHNLPSGFDEAALAEAENAEPPVLKNHSPRLRGETEEGGDIMPPSPTPSRKQEGDRVDLRDIPLVTIDGEDARDFDDAVFAEKDGDGFHLVIAIADVAHYVKEDSALDAAAFERGNSVYFPDRVIPMLPERLSNGLCSLNPDEDRYCLAVHVWIDGGGVMKRYKFVRGLMRSRYRFTYNDLQASYDVIKQNPSPQKGEVGRGAWGDETSPARCPHPNPSPMGEGIIKNLYAAYEALATERDNRGALDLNLPEYYIVFDGAGNVSNIAPRTRLEAHRLIETFMIAANVAAADYLLKNKAPGIYRVHEPPAEERLDELRQFLKHSGYHLQDGVIRAAHLNRVLKASEGKPDMQLIHTSILRAQMQAYYSHENLGHFGLGLQKYCHFTSPIRRYSDLVVHRALTRQMSEDRSRISKNTSLKSNVQHLASVALHISETERRAMMAERDAADRYKVSYMTKHIGNTFPGLIVSVNEYGLFVALRDTGVTGFVPVRNLSGDYFVYDKRHARFKGSRSKLAFAIGDPIMIRVQEANAMTGSLIFEPEKGLTLPPHEHKPRHFHKGKKDRGNRRRE